MLSYSMPQIQHTHSSNPDTLIINRTKDEEIEHGTGKYYLETATTTERTSREYVEENEMEYSEPEATWIHKEVVPPWARCDLSGNTKKQKTNEQPKQGQKASTRLGSPPNEGNKTYFSVG